VYRSLLGLDKSTMPNQKVEAIRFGLQSDTQEDYTQGVSLCVYACVFVSEDGSVKSQHLGCKATLRRITHKVCLCVCLRMGLWYPKVWAAKQHQGESQTRCVSVCVCLCLRICLWYPKVWAAKQHQGESQTRCVSVCVCLCLRVGLWYHKVWAAKGHQWGPHTRFGQILQACERTYTKLAGVHVLSACFFTREGGRHHKVWVAKQHKQRQRLLQ